MEKATKYLMLEDVLNEKVYYNNMIKVVDKNIIKAYVNALIKKVLVDDGKVLSIEFTNGMAHRFIYK